MFALRFERDCIVAQETNGPNDRGGHTMVESRSYRVDEVSDAINVYIPNENGVEICHVVGAGRGSWDRCYVMNDSGATIDKIRAPEITACAGVLPLA